MNAKEKMPDQLPDRSELRRIRSAVRKRRQGIVDKLKKQFGLSITKETALPAMQRFTDMLSSDPGLPGGRFSKKLAERNRKLNARCHQLRTYAGRQGGGGYCDMLMFGLFRMKFNGCEVIAAYNVLHYLGYKTDIRDVSYSFETNGSMLLGGLGVRPDSIEDYLKEKTSARVTSLGPAHFNDYDARFADAKAAVFTFWNGPDRWTIHTVMIRHMKNGRIRVFNLYRNRLFSDFDSIAALCAGTRERLIPISLILIGD